MSRITGIIAACLYRSIIWNPFQEKLEQVKEREPHVDRLQKRLEELSAPTTDTPSDWSAALIGAVQTEFAAFAERWEAVVERISGLLETLTRSLDTAPESRLREAIDALLEFLDAAEHVLGTRGFANAEQTPIAVAKLQRVKVLPLTMHTCRS